MPPRTRAVRALKASKENAEVLTKTSTRNVGKITKAARIPLADKTNSASDENVSPEPVKKVVKKSNKPSQKVVPAVVVEERPRRNRRLPPRYIENQVLSNLSNGKDNVTTPVKSVNKTPVKDASKVESPFKTPTNVLDNSIIANRPKRVSRLPSKFDENSVSPHKFVPIHCPTSTPLVPKPQNTQNVNEIEVSKQKLTLQASENDRTPLRVSPKKAIQKETLQNGTPQKSTPNKPIPKKVTTSKATPLKVTPTKESPLKISPQKSKPMQKKVVQKKISEVVENMDKDGKQDRVRRLRKPVKYKEDTLSPKVKSPEKGKPINSEDRKILKVNSSFRVLEEKKSKGDQDIYEFTFDPSEEPAPQKKKRKKITTKKPTTSKPKVRVYNNNYEKNIARALADLKNVVTKQKPDDEIVSKPTKPLATNKIAVQSVANKVPTKTPAQSSVVISTVAQIHHDPAQNASVRSNTSTAKHVSIRVEDIAADFDASIDHDINYSPVTSPMRIETEPENHLATSPEREEIRPDDPLNLRNELSFFDDQPVANSSMNVSTRNPNATPWRAEFEKLPLKWQANTYVKSDMTPALECSFINNFDDSKKKHVYTDMVAPTDELLPEIQENEAPKLKQTSIISFIKEVVERSSSKKKRGAPATPTKAQSLFDMPDVYNKTPRKDTSGKSNDSMESPVSGKKSQKRKNNSDNNPTPAKLPRKDNDTLFGFDDSENQENVSPVKIADSNRLKTLRSRSGAVLRDLNKQTGPMRAELPAAMRANLAPSSDAVEKIYDQMKSAADAPAMLDKPGNGETTKVPELPVEDLDDSQSVHLFEDIELVHHAKPTRKSYGKAKKVAFQNANDSSSEEEAPLRNQSSDDEDDLGDLSFHLPEVQPKKATKKKKTKKQILSKKEKAEVDAWAACFNSMCEDIEEFDLVVE